MRVSEGGETFYTASQWQLMWWKFRKHKAALVAIGVLLFLYLIAIFADLLTPYAANERFGGWEICQPASIHFRDESGKWVGPSVYKLGRTVDTETFRVKFVEDRSERYPVRFFIPAEPRKALLGVMQSWRLFGVEEGQPVFLFGSDNLGRDVFSRTLYASRISMFIGFGGVILTFVFGVTLGGIAGYLGGVVDEVIMRVVDFMVATPTIPLWMGLAAAIPRDWSVTNTYFAITIILSVLGWGGLARTVRGKLLSLREEDYIMAARVYGASPARLIGRYMLPNFMSYLLVNITIAVPYTILGETSLSFLGLGIQPPAVSWGTLLRDAQQLTVVAQRPWQMIPGIFVVLTVLMFNFIGDGLRDAADPYSRL
ncbi:MAG: ABC transporter permease [Anaerolineae bacterium]|jgi:peptide/nickel transport system permease protein|nr:ABC transporter permease [Anaerolineae bacterium]